ncbi:single-stranded DNA-binding protein [Alistipes indistinctus]|uniref:single-stranded DNA-binding protein n=1 Tax=Alistipes indistinctus TaxID=626932 RepID=UPI003BF5D020
MINKVILIGNVGADPEVRALEGGVKVARLRIATTERIYNRQTQETKEHTEWHNVTLWRNLADVADRFIRKGSQVYIEGSLRTRDWTDKDGNKRYATEIVANDLKMLGRRGDASASGADNSYGGSYGGAAQSSQSSPSPSGDIAASAPQEVDDLPF